MSNVLSYDILVVGAGPAGARAAAAAAEAGAKTLLIDRKMRIGEAPHCGEFVPARIFTEFPLDRDCVCQSVQFMETRVLATSKHDCDAEPAGHLLSEPGASAADSINATVWTTRSTSPGFIIDRARFDRDLAREAAEKGATVLSGTRLLRREGRSWVLKSGGERLSVRPALIIAADGASSTVAEALSLRRPEALLGIQQEAPLVSPLEGAFIFLDQSFVGGYGWLFPKGNAANVGIGVVPGTGVRPTILLERFLEGLRKSRMIRPGRLAVSSGLIPVSGMRERLVFENVIFCGDAASLTHPITGAGIPQAVISGELAGRAAASALKNGNDRFLAQYEEEVRAMYHGVLSHARSKRLLMMERWNDADFERTCEQTWIAFKGYRKRIRRQ